MGFGRMIAVAAALMAGPVVQAGDAPQPERALYVFAHPDDELVVAPSIARATREGQAVTVVYATSGDQGPGVSTMARGAALAAHREDEARCAMRALGNPNVAFLRLGDGALGLADHGPDGPSRKLAAALEPVLHDGEYDTVVTWGPDGGYGHTDHRMVSALVTQLVQAKTESRPVLLYPGIRKGTLPPVPEMQTWAETDPALLEVSVGYLPEDLAAATRAAECHASQFDAATRGGIMALFDQSIWQGAVYFRAAFAQ